MNISIQNDLPSSELIAQIKAGVGLIDTNDRLIQVNAYMARLLGYSIKDLIGQPIATYIKPEQETLLQIKLDRLKQGHNFFLPVSFLGKDGQYIESLLSFSAIQSDDKGYQGAAFIILDIHQDLFLQLLIERQVLQKGRKLWGLNQIMNEITRSWDLKRLLNLVFSSIQTTTGFDGGGFFAYRSENPTFYVHPHGDFIELPGELIRNFREIRAKRPELLDKKVWVLSKMNPSPEHVKMHNDFFRLISPEFKNPDAFVAFSFQDQKRTSGIFGFFHQNESAFTAEMMEIADMITTHAAISIENMYLMKDLENLAAEKERLRLSRELHDSVAQGLYSLTLYCEASRRALSAKKIAVVEENLNEMTELTRDALRNLRFLIFELRPPIVEDVGFIGAIMTRLEAVERRVGSHTEYNVYGESKLSNEVENELYWIVHEALNNVLKHASADNVCVDIHFLHNSTLIFIKDDGVGFTPGNPKSSPGVGLKSITERVEKLGGTFKIQSEINHGTTLEIRIDHSQLTL